MRERNRESINQIDRAKVSTMASLQLLRRTLGTRYLASRANPSTTRFFSSDASTPIRATLFPGDGIGPEISESVKQVSLPPFLLPLRSTNYYFLNISLLFLYFFFLFFRLHRLLISVKVPLFFY